MWTVIAGAPFMMTAAGLAGIAQPRKAPSAAPAVRLPQVKVAVKKTAAGKARLVTTTKQANGKVKMASAAPLTPEVVAVTRQRQTTAKRRTTRTVRTSRAATTRRAMSHRRTNVATRRAPMASHAQRRNCFTPVVIQSKQHLLYLLHTDHKFRKNLARHFRMSEPELIRCINENVKYSVLKQDTYVTNHGVTRTGRIFSFRQRMPKGSPVFTMADGTLVLKAACGNPIGVLVCPEPRPVAVRPKLPPPPPITPEVFPVPGIAMLPPPVPAPPVTVIQIPPAPIPPPPPVIVQVPPHPPVVVPPPPPPVIVEKTVNKSRKLAIIPIPLLFIDNDETTRKKTIIIKKPCPPCDKCNDKPCPPIPEPSTAALLGITLFGGGGFVLMRRRRGVGSIAVRPFGGGAFG
jgi:hypothetical protein